MKESTACPEGAEKACQKKNNTKSNNEKQIISWASLGDVAPNPLNPLAKITGITGRGLETKLRMVLATCKKKPNSWSLNQ